MSDRLIFGIVTCSGWSLMILTMIIRWIMEWNVEKKIERLLKNSSELSDQDFAYLLFLAEWLGHFGHYAGRLTGSYWAHKRRTRLPDGVITELAVIKRNEVIWWMSWTGNPRLSANPEFTLPDPAEIDERTFEEFKRHVIRECLRHYT